MNDLAKNLLLWVIVAVVLLAVFESFEPSQSSASSEMAYSAFLDEVHSDAVKSVEFSGDTPSRMSVLSFELKNGTHGTTMGPEDKDLVNDLRYHKIDFTQEKPSGGGLFWTIVINILPTLIFVGIFLYVMRQMQQGGAGKGAMSFGRSRAKMQGEDQVKITFADVAGCDEAKGEVAELVEFLRDPGKFQKLGGKIPRGVLMVGPPGTGKTLLARAIAGEAKVPFFSISGSDFVEMFVGVGASRVRDMFEQAKKHAPCIIFIDEIDAVGRHRGAGLGGGHDEREQTLNALLVEMDGFEGSEGIIVIAATNRPDVLDPATAAPGSLRPPGRRRIARRARPRADPAGAHAQGADGRGRQADGHRARHARLLRCGSRQPRQRSGPVRRARERARSAHGSFRARERQDHDGHRTPLDGHERRREAQHRVSRSGPRDRRQADARARSCPQGHDHSGAGARSASPCSCPKPTATATTAPSSRATCARCTAGAWRKS